MSEKFNIFQVAGIYQSEEIHTKIIAELINPESDFHDYGQQFLNIFIEEIGTPVGLNVSDFIGATVETEKSTDEGRRIDMVVFTDEIYLPFEVKIWAGDSKNQITDYYKFAKTQCDNVPALFYLTPNGRKPYDISMEDMEKCEKEIVYNISFKNDIAKWLYKCIIFVNNDPDDEDELIQLLLGQLRNNILRFCNAFNEVITYDEVIEKLREKLLEKGILCTECAPNYLTITLNKIGALEYALRIERDLCSGSVSLKVINGVEQANGIPNYGKTSEYIHNHSCDFITLTDETFNGKLDINKNKWEKYTIKPTIAWTDEDDIITFSEKCVEAVCSFIKSIEKYRSYNA